VDRRPPQEQDGKAGLSRWGNAIQLRHGQQSETAPPYCAMTRVAREPIILAGAELIEERARILETLETRNGNLLEAGCFISRRRNPKFVRRPACRMVANDRVPTSQSTSSQFPLCRRRQVVHDRRMIRRPQGCARGPRREVCA
jgi:hypothetical protein